MTFHNPNGDFPFVFLMSRFFVGFDHQSALLVHAGVDARPVDAAGHKVASFEASGCKTILAFVFLFVVTFDDEFVTYVSNLEMLVTMDRFLNGNNFRYVEIIKIYFQTNSIAKITKEINKNSVY